MLIDTRLQKWNMSTEGWEEVLLDVEIAVLVRAAVRETFDGISSDDSELDLELVDIAIERWVLFIYTPHALLNMGLHCRSGNLVVLVSYAGLEEAMPMAMDIGSHPRRIYALIRLSHLAEVFKVDSVNSVPYQSVRLPSLFYLCSILNRDLCHTIDVELWCSGTSADTADPERCAHQCSIW